MIKISRLTTMVKSTKKPKEPPKIKRGNKMCDCGCMHIPLKGKIKTK